jgi:hypothetical protein
MRRLTQLLAALLIAGIMLPGCGGSSAPGGTAEAPIPAKQKENDDIMQKGLKDAQSKRTGRGR